MGLAGCGSARRAEVERDRAGLGTVGPWDAAEAGRNGRRRGQGYRRQWNAAVQRLVGKAARQVRRWKRGEAVEAAVTVERDQPGLDQSAAGRDNPDLRIGRVQLLGPRVL